MTDQIWKGQFIPEGNQGQFILGGKSLSCSIEKWMADLNCEDFWKG